MATDLLSSATDSLCGVCWPLDWFPYSEYWFIPHRQYCLPDNGPHKTLCSMGFHKQHTTIASVYSLTSWSIAECIRVFASSFLYNKTTTQPSVRGLRLKQHVLKAPLVSPKCAAFSRSQKTNLSLNRPRTGQLSRIRTVTSCFAFKIVHIRSSASCAGASNPPASSLHYLSQINIECFSNHPCCQLYRVSFERNDQSQITSGKQRCSPLSFHTNFGSQLS